MKTHGALSSDSGNFFLKKWKNKRYPLRKKPNPSKEIRSSWKKHPKGRYHSTIVTPLLNIAPKDKKSNPKLVAPLPVNR